MYFRTITEPYVFQNQNHNSDPSVSGSGYTFCASMFVYCLDCNSFTAINPKMILSYFEYKNRNTNMNV